MEVERRRADVARRRRIALVIGALLAVMIAGCTPRTQSPPSVTPPDSEYTPPPNDPSLDPHDVAGRVPADAAYAVVEAANACDWESLYSLYATPAVDFAIAEREWSDAAEATTDFLVHETRVSEEATAFVRVTYVASTTPPGGERYEVVVEEPGEWWPVHQVVGHWKVKWLPRQ